MKILFISFSDMHFTENENIISTRFDKIFDSIKNVDTEIVKVVILVSGDISYSGKTNEFFEAIYLFDFLVEKLTKYLNCEVIVIPSPGNHDCEFLEDSKNIRKIIIEDIYKNEEANLDSHIIDICCSTQKSFFDFRNSLASYKLLRSDNKIIYQYEIELSQDIQIKINCFNTSWLSQIKEQQGKLYIPTNYFPQESKFNKSDLTVSLLHHPYNWYSEANGRKFREYLDKNSDIIITGHEHIKEQYIKIGSDGNFTNYIESDSLQNNDLNHSGFNLIIVDIIEQKQKVLNCNWINDKYEQKILSDWFDYKRFHKIHKHPFQLTEDFSKILVDIGINITHPSGKPALDDLYVYPTLLDLNFETTSSNTLKEYKSSESIFNFKDLENNKIIIVGAEGSGKTALSKSLFKRNYNDFLLPIYIDGKDINSTSTDDIKKEIEKAFIQEYGNNKLEEFKQLDKDKVLIIVDDFHRAKINNKYKPIFISNLIKIHPNIVVTVNSYFLFEEIMSKREKPSLIYDQFLKYQLTEFGHVLRNRLICKWINLGCCDKFDEIELQRKLYNSEKTINTIVGKNFIPAYPIFLLTILQTIEAGTPIGIQASQYGYYYQYLISQALIRTLEHDEIDFYDNYLTEFSYFLFDNDLRELSKNNVSIFHKFYCEKYSVDKSLEKILDNLVKAELFDLTDGVYWIKYTYVFYYYIAKYFSNNLTSNVIKEKVIAMSKRIYREEFANIILFLTHLSRDPFILELLISNAQEIFSETIPIKFEQDTNSINNLIESLPKEVLENKTSEEVHGETLKMKDEIEQLDSDESSTSKNYISPLKDSLDEDISLIDIISRLNYAFKTIEILGQIAKKYYASIDGELKYKLTNETYLLGLRAINLFLSELEGDPEILINELERLIENKDINKEKVEVIARNLVVGLSLIISYGFIEKVAYSIGSEQLAQTYDKILENNQTNAYRLINIAIKLDFFKNNPINEIRENVPFLKKNQLAFVLLRQFVIRYLYMFKTNYELKAQICSLLDISINRQNEIEAKSKDIKR